MRWERNKEKEESWVGWRKEQSEDEVEKRDRWSLVCDMAPQMFQLLGSAVALCAGLNHRESR